MKLAFEQHCIFLLIITFHPMLNVLFQMFGEQNSVNRFFFIIAPNGGGAHFIYFPMKQVLGKTTGVTVHVRYEVGQDQRRQSIGPTRPAMLRHEYSLNLQPCSVQTHTNYSCKLVTTRTAVYVCAFVVGVTAVLLCMHKSLCVEISWRNQFTLPLKIFI